MNALIQKNFNILSILNVIYGLAGVLIYIRVQSWASATSFGLGWLIVVVNLELLKWLGTFFLMGKGSAQVSDLTEAESTETRGSKALITGLMMGKLMFWGMVTGILSTLTWIQGGPFVVGALTLVFSSLGLVFKLRERNYARTA